MATLTLEQRIVNEATASLTSATQIASAKRILSALLAEGDAAAVKAMMEETHESRATCYRKIEGLRGMLQASALAQATAARLESEQTSADAQIAEAMDAIGDAALEARTAKQQSTADFFAQTDGVYGAINGCWLHHAANMIADHVHRRVILSLRDQYPILSQKQDPRDTIRARVEHLHYAGLIADLDQRVKDRLANDPAYDSLRKRESRATRNESQTRDHLRRLLTSDGLCDLRDAATLVNSLSDAATARDHGRANRDLRRALAEMPRGGMIVGQVARVGSQVAQDSDALPITQAIWSEAQRASTLALVNVQRAQIAWQSALSARTQARADLRDTADSLRESLRADAKDCARRRAILDLRGYCLDEITEHHRFARARRALVDQRAEVAIDDSTLWSAWSLPIDQRDAALKIAAVCNWPTRESDAQITIYESHDADARKQNLTIPAQAVALVKRAGRSVAACKVARKGHVIYTDDSTLIARLRALGAADATDAQGMACLHVK